MRFSLGFILAISLAGLQFLAITIVVSTSYVTSEQAMVQHARTLLAEAGTNASEHSSGFLTPVREAAELTSRILQNDIVAKDDPAALEKLLFQSLQGEQQLSGLFYGDEAGNFVYVMRSDGPGPFRTKFVQIEGETRQTRLIWRDANFAVIHQEEDPGDNFDPRTRPWYKRAKGQGGAIWTDPYIFFSSQAPGISAAAPVLSEGKLAGVVGVDIEISTISGFLSQLVISEHGTALILNSNGQVIAHPDIAQLMHQDGDALRFARIEDIADPIARAALANLTFAGAVAIKDETQSDFTYHNNRYVSLLKPVLGVDLPWTIAIYAPEDDFTKTIKDNRRRNIWLAVIISLVTGLIGVALAELILKPVRAFAVRTSLVSQGEMSGSEPLPRTYNELNKANETLIDQIAQRRDADAKIEELNRDLSHFSRVNLMGQMATGLAHELSQPLTAISQNVDAAISTAKEQVPEDPELLQLLEELDEQAHRGGDILRTLRGLVRKEPGDATAFDLGELLEQTRRLLQQDANVHSVTLRMEAPEQQIVIANRVQIAQVLINLVRNAMEAIAADDSPRREVIVRVDPSRWQQVEVCVEDTGPGIAPGVTLFKRFETSKPTGMGLGLSICRTIAEANGGRLWYDDTCQGKTRFCLTLKKDQAEARTEE